MQKWEYKQFMITVAERNGRLLLYSINGQQPPNWSKGPTIDEYLSQLGTEGWELVAVTSGSQAYNNCYVFKRPLS